MTDCVTCGLAAGYNRAVVDVVEDRELGGLCVRCEERGFGRSLTFTAGARDDRCTFCDRDGFYALPEWRPYTVEEGGATVCKVDYRVDETSLRFCDEHFSTLVSSAGPRDAGVGRPNSEGRHR